MSGYTSSSALRARTVAIAAILCVGWLVAVPAMGVVVAEWDFRAGTGNLSLAKPGASSTATVLGGTVDASANAGLGTAAAEAASGRFNIAGGGGEGDQRGLITSGANSTYSNYLGGSGEFRPATVLAVYKTNVARSTSYRSLLSSAKFFGSNGTTLFIGRHPSQDPSAPDYLGLNVGGGSAGNAFVTATTSTVSTSMWDTSVWYVVGGSWAPGQPAVVYRRALTGTDIMTELFGQSPTSLTAVGSGLNFAPLAVGSTQFFGGTEPFQIGADGSIALMRVFDSYTSSATGFRSLFNSVFPEPASGMVLAGVGLLVLRRNRR